MCGIAGFINDPADDSRLRRVPLVLDRLCHRGPDDWGFLVYSRDKLKRGRHWCPQVGEAEVVLLHRRLSIIDLSEAGWQPMSTHDGRYHLVFNGEIYNYLELRDELARMGHQFHTNSDTEVLLEAVVEWGLSALPRFVGMFAFALLDVRERKLILARDFFGIKPLYYTTAGPFAFASELKSLLEFGSISHKVNPEVTYRCLRFGLCDYGPETMLCDVAQLSPAHYMEIPLDDSQALHEVCYWRPDIDEIRDLSFDEAAEILRDLFLDSVRLHLRSDVPLGAALSGGIDSSSIVMAIRILEPKIDLNTFSFIADEEGISEEAWVDIVGRSAGANVHKIRVAAEDLARDLERLTCVQDQPIAGSSPYAQYRVFQRAHEAGIKVMIDGQGADEILAGYRYYLAARLASLVRKNQWVDACKLLAQCSRLPGGPNLSWMIMRTAGYLLPPSLQPLMRKLGGQELMPMWLNRSWFRQHGVKPEALTVTLDHDVLRYTLVQELTSASIPQLLRYEDRNSMAFSIESRVPFLTPKLVSFVLSLPEQYLIARDGTSKAIFRRAMRGIVPNQILARRDKIGFATPELGWMSSVRPWINGIINSDTAAEVLPLNLPALAAEWEGVSRGQIPFRSQLWRALNLIKWTEQFQAQYN